jgi:hypothetical protein
MARASPDRGHRSLGGDRDPGVHFLNTAGLVDVLTDELRLMPGCDAEIVRRLPRVKARA